MRTILVLASMWMLVSMIEASSSLEPVRHKSGRVVWKNGKRLRVRKFRTTTTAGTTTTTTTTTTTEAPTTSTTSEPPPTNQNATWDDMAENIEKNFKFESLFGSSSSLSPNRAQRGLSAPRGSEFDDSMGSSSSDNVIDLGEQDIENLDLTKLYDRDTSKDDPNAPTVLQFVAPSSTSYMDPAYISRIIQQQLGEGYEYTNYTITPSAITSDYSAPFPKAGFKLPPPPMEKLNGPPPGFVAQEEHTVRPTKHESPPVQSTHQSPPPPSSGSPAPATPNGNYGLPTQEYSSPPVKSSSYSSAVRGQSGYNPQRIKGFAQVLPTKVYARPSPTPQIYSSPSPPPPIYASPNPPQIFTVSPNPPLQIYSSPTPPPLIYSSPSPPPIYIVPRPPVVYNSPSSAPVFSTKAPPTHYSGPPKGTYSSPTQSTYIIPKDYQVGLSAPGQGYSTLVKGSVNPTSNEFIHPPKKGSPASLWTNYVSSAPKENNYDLPPVKVSFPDTNSKAPEYKAPETYSTLSEQMVAPGLTPAIIGGYGVSDGQPEVIQPEKYSSTEVRGFPSGQGDINAYSAPADDSGPTTIVRHHHHYVNYVGTGTGGEQSNPSGSFDASESVYRAPKNIFETLGGSNGYSPPADSVGPSIIYGKPAPQLAYRFPTTASSIVKFPEPSSDDSGSQVAYQSPVGPQESYNPSSSYGPPEPGPSYGPPQPGPSYGPPQPDPSYGPPRPDPSYGPPQPGPSYEPPPRPGPSYGPPPEEETPEERPKILKTIYVNLPPEQNAPRPPPIKHKIPLAPQRHYKIVFIKAPTPPPAPEQEVELPPPPESKTLIYVLHKKPEPPKPIKIVTPKPTEPSAPLVHFIQYKKEGNDIQIPSGDYGLPSTDSSGPGNNIQKPSGDYRLSSTDSSGPGNNIQEPSGDYGLPSTGSSGSANNIHKPSGDYGLPSTDPSGPANNIQKPSGDYGLPSAVGHTRFDFELQLSSAGHSGEKGFTPGTPLGLTDLGYDVSSSESKVQVQVTKSVSSTK